METPCWSRSALIDITNDSPIVGLAMETPSFGSRAKSVMMMMTPGSGEALLRGQVKILLQKVEEKEEPHHQLSKDLTRPSHANITNLCEDEIGGSTLPVVEERLRTCEVVSLETQKSVITKSLLLDFAEQVEEDEYYEEEEEAR